MPSLVLASGSPRRAALLSEGGFEFEIASPRVAEKFDAALTLRELTLWNAIRKGMSISQTRPDAVVLAADTLVALENQVIGKPADLNETAQTLRRLNDELTRSVLPLQSISRHRGDPMFFRMFRAFVFVV